MLFGSGRGTRLAWHLTYRASDRAHYDAVVDAATGAVLFRQNLVKHAVPAEVFLSHPAAGTAVVRRPRGPWLDPGALVLNGPYAHVYSDVDDSNTLSAGEEIQRTLRRTVTSSSRSMTSAGVGCGSAAQCSWDPILVDSWQDNRKQNGVQAFYLVNRFRDHLANPNIGFTGFSGADAVRVETDDGAARDPQRLNNASMATLPEGIAPLMQLHLFGGLGFRSVNAGDSAAIVWHEYTHGLSNRLVVHDDGSGALSSPQAGAMGEGWSDWYALDLLAADNPAFDTSAAGDVNLGHYVDFSNPDPVRIQGIDCPVAAATARCPGGGYTYGDFGHVAGFPEVHRDGEIWAQTLWDLRTAVGRNVAQKLITEGMRMSPPEPSFLDMRNAILAADAGLGGVNRNADLAGVRRARDGLPGAHRGRRRHRADPGLQPAAGARRPARGHDRHRDLARERPGAGERRRSASRAWSARRASPTASSRGRRRTGRTRSTRPSAPTARWRSSTPATAACTLPGFVVGGTRVQDVALRRDWAASAGGGVVSGADDSGAPFGCGLARLNDQLLTSGWSAVNSGDPSAVVRLPAGDRRHRLRARPHQHVRQRLRSRDPRLPGRDLLRRRELHHRGSRARSGPLDRGRLHVLPADARNVRCVRLTLRSPLAAGSDFIDFSELAVYGAPPNQLPAGSLAASRLRLTAGGTVDFAASFTDPDSRIVGYDWDFDGDGAVDRSTAEPSTSFTYSRAGGFTARVAVRDYRGGAGSASRAITVTPTRRPVVRLPRRGRRGRATARVTCAERCVVTARLRVDGRVVRTARRTLRTTRERRITVALPRKARRAALRRDRRSLRARLTVRARYGDGRSTTARRTVRIRL